MFYKVFTGKSCFPLPVALTGTFVSSGTTITTSIPVSLPIGSHVYSSTYNQISKVIGIGNAPNTYTIQTAFSDDVNNDVLQITDSSIIYNKVSITNFDDADGLLNGQTFPKRTIQDIEEEGIAFTLDGTGTHISLLAVV